MRIHILSDLHLEFGSLTLPHVEADVTVLAGDVRPGRSALAWIRENLPVRPVIYILGNHEFYGGALPKLIEDFRRMSLGTNLRILENECLHIDGVRFLGCTLWTDFRLFGDPAAAGRRAAAIMNDYRLIRVSPEFRRLRGLDTARLHAGSMKWLREQLEQDRKTATVLVTHHAPSARSLDPGDAGDLISAAYASNLDEMVAATRARLWIHGHIHRPVDYCIGETRVLCNPRGYADLSVPAGFDPGLVVEV
jgi:3',5'-cyclic AMP phosphodiesterase CpdA